MSSNDLTDIPFTIGFLPLLARVVLNGNPLRAARKALSCESAQDLARFLRTRAPEAEARRLEATLLHTDPTKPSGPSVRARVAAELGPEAQLRVHAAVPADLLVDEADVLRSKHLLATHALSLQPSKASLTTASAEASATRAVGVRPVGIPGSALGELDWSLLLRDAISASYFGLAGAALPRVPRSPFASGALRGLKELDLSGNDLDHPASPSSRCVLLHELPTQCPALVRLSLSCCRLRTPLPGSWLNFGALETLDLSGNALGALDVENLVSAVEELGFDVSGTFERFPPLFTTLVSLDLSRNKLQHVPSLFIMLPRLSSLSLAANGLDIAAADDEWLEVPCIRSLDLSANRLTRVPQTVMVSVCNGASRTSGCRDSSC